MYTFNKSQMKYLFKTNEERIFHRHHCFRLQQLQQHSIGNSKNKKYPKKNFLLSTTKSKDDDMTSTALAMQTTACYIAISNKHNNKKI
jgi:uncharacterized protein YrrD